MRIAVAWLWVLFGCVAGHFSPALAQIGGTFTSTGSMVVPRYRHTATLLPDGRVFIAGGGSAIVELYDPASGTFAPLEARTASENVGSATLLPSGKVLLIERQGAELYDPSTGTITGAGGMIEEQTRFAATLLPNGKVLITGGVTAGGRIAEPELYDPSTGTFSLAGSYSRRYPADDFGSTATLLPDGTVLFAAEPLYTNDYGGELYDPDTGAFRATGPMISNINGRSATLLANGKVLLAGGADEDARYARAEVYDPSTGTFTATADMTEPRNAHAAVLLPDGKALVTGGEGWGPAGEGQCCWFLGSLASAEIYDPAAGMFTRTADMIARREWHNATVLHDGRVLITGGLYYGGIGLLYGALSSAEIYTPPSPDR